MNGDGKIAQECGLKEATPPKSSAADRAIKYLVDSGAGLFHDQHGDGFISFRNSQGRREVWPLRSKAASEFIRWQFYQAEQKGLTGEALATARGTLAATARFAGPRHDLSVRVAHHEGACWYDLGDWRAVRVTPAGWFVIEEPPILFRHYPHQLPQVEPKHWGSLKPSLRLVNVSGEATRLLVEVYLVAALLPGIPLPVLVVHGDQGSAKSFFFRLLRKLLDPSSLETLAPPDNLREFVQLAAHHRTVYLDNLTRLPDWLSDALCRLCTGDGFSKRELYSDDDDILYHIQGLGGVNGINLVATKPDLLDRALVLKLEPIPDNQRREEQALWADFDAMRPSVLGAMFDALAQAMARYPKVQLVRAPRLADFARWGCAIAEALGYEAAEFLEAYGQNVQAQNQAALDESPLAQAILGFAPQEGAWEGTASGLLEELNARADQWHVNMRAKGWPKAPNVLSRRLREVRPNLLRAGVKVAETRSKGITVWFLCRKGQEDIAPTATITTLPGVACPSTDAPASPPTMATSLPPDGVSPPAEPLPNLEGSGGGDDGDTSAPSAARTSASPATDGPSAGRKRVSL